MKMNIATAITFLAIIIQTSAFGVPSCNVNNHHQTVMTNTGTTTRLRMADISLEEVLEVTEGNEIEFDDVDT